MGFQMVSTTFSPFSPAYVYLMGIFLHTRTSNLFLLFDLGSELVFCMRLLTDTASFVDILLWSPTVQPEADA